MVRLSLIFLVLVLFSVTAKGEAVVADSMSHRPLPNASVFDRHGKLSGSCRSDGRLPYIPAADYPVTIRYMGFKEHVLSNAAGVDTIFLQELITELPEVVIESRQHKLLHIPGLCQRILHSIDLYRHRFPVSRKNG